MPGRARSLPRVAGGRRRDAPWHGEPVTSRVHTRPHLPDLPAAGGRRLSLVQRQIVALLVAVLALAIQALLRDHAAASYYPVYLAAVAVSAWLGGLVPGLVTAAVVTVGVLGAADSGFEASDWLMSALAGAGVAW